MMREHVQGSEMKVGVGGTQASAMCRANDATCAMWCVLHQFTPACSSDLVVSCTSILPGLLYNRTLGRLSILQTSLLHCSKQLALLGKAWTDVQSIRLTVRDAYNVHDAPSYKCCASSAFSFSFVDGTKFGMWRRTCGSRACG